jgi:hypothetical protein
MENAMSKLAIGRAFAAAEIAFGLSLGAAMACDDQIGATAKTALSDQTKPDDPRPRNLVLRLTPYMQVGLGRSDGQVILTAHEQLNRYGGS